MSIKVPNDKILEDIQKRRAAGQQTELSQIIYYPSDENQLRVICVSADDASCLYSIIGPDGTGESTVFVSGTPEQLECCVKNVGQLAPNPDGR